MTWLGILPMFVVNSTFTYRRDRGEGAKPTRFEDGEASSPSFHFSFVNKVTRASGKICFQFEITFKLLSGLSWTEQCDEVRFMLWARMTACWIRETSIELALSQVLHFGLKLRSVLHKSGLFGRVSDVTWVLDLVCFYFAFCASKVLRLPSMKIGLRQEHHAVQANHRRWWWLEKA